MTLMRRKKHFVYPLRFTLGSSQFKLTKERLVKEKDVYFGMQHQYMQECPVMGNSKGWLEFGASISDLVHGRDGEEKAAIGRMNRFL